MTWSWETYREQHGEPAKRGGVPNEPVKRRVSPVAPKTRSADEARYDLLRRVQGTVFGSQLYNHPGEQGLDAAVDAAIARAKRA